MATPVLRDRPRTEDDLDHAARVFLAERTRLFRIAYRVIGNVAGAEDVVQETWLRWQRTNRDEINNPAAFLTTATTHLAINVIQSARHRHEVPTDSPMVDLIDPSQDPTRQVECSAVVHETLDLLMARLTSPELGAYLLRKGFDYPYREIARVLRTSIPNARQLVRRAQVSITRGRARRVDRGVHRQLVAAFLAAARSGDLSYLEELLARQANQAPRCPATSRTTRPSDGATHARAASGYASVTATPGSVDSAAGQPAGCGS
jgi:RNA polymerase sigma-70 factor (ECF subfamily)